MVRIKRGTVKKTRRKFWLKQAKGFMGRGSKCHVIAKRLAIRARQFAFTGRKDKKSNFRTEFIGIINAYCKTMKSSYSKFIHQLNQSPYQEYYNRKIMSMMIQQDKDTFTSQIYNKVMHVDA